MRKSEPSAEKQTKNKRQGQPAPDLFSEGARGVWARGCVGRGRAVRCARGSVSSKVAYAKSACTAHSAAPAACGRRTLMLLRYLGGGGRRAGVSSAVVESYQIHRLKVSSDKSGTGFCARSVAPHWHWRVPQWQCSQPVPSACGGSAVRRTPVYSGAF